MATENDETVNFRKTPGAWTISIPSALLTAVLTAVATGMVTRLMAPEPPTRADAREVARALAEIQESQRKILDRLSEVDRDARNRDTVQDASIAALRNR